MDGARPSNDDGECFAEMRANPSAEEVTSLRCQTGILKTGRGQHRKYLPHAFTEQGVAMLSSVLRSRRAVLVNVEIMRAFLAVRREAGRYETLGRKLAEL